VCAAPLAAAGLPAGFACGRCRSSPPAFERLHAGWRYEPPLDAVIARLKFGRLDYLGSHLGRALARRLEDRLVAPPGGQPTGRSGVRPGCELVVPVPLHWRRRLARGYDQAAAIARPLARELDLPFAAVLVRRRPTPPQTALGRADRLSNLDGAFAVRLRGRERIRGRRLLLVDDVATTGATLDAAAAALRRAGAAAVVALVAARTP
jgi:ComF family protein